MEKKHLKHADLTAKVIGCCMRIHSKLGRGYREVIYERALKIELSREGIAFQNQYKLSIFYFEEFIGISLLDFLIEESIVVELKAAPELTDSHFAQTFNYLEIGNFELGLLINFGESSLNFKRLTNKKIYSCPAMSHTIKESNHTLF